MKAQSLPRSNYIKLFFSLISCISMSFDKSPTSPPATSRLVSPLSPKSPPLQSPRTESPRSPTHSGSMSPTPNGDAKVRLPRFTLTALQSCLAQFPYRKSYGDTMVQCSLYIILQHMYGNSIQIPMHLYSIFKNSIILPMYQSTMMLGLPLKEHWLYDIYCFYCGQKKHRYYKRLKE